ncbi:MAG: DUF4124 domain-containing protein [Deltaproteobacteria bacterium]|nr:DUF4124 domain-containing protein [Deltaproteobacteria bacterium]
MYKWRDKQGKLHFTDNIEEVPEPFRSRFLRQDELEDLKKGASMNSGQTPAPSSGQRENQKTYQNPRYAKPPAYKGPSTEETQKLYWQSEVSRWKHELESSGRKYSKMKKNYDNLMRRFRETHAIARRNEAEKLKKKMDRVKQRMDLAEKMLKHVLPDRARKEGVPPGWLRQ